MTDATVPTIRFDPAKASEGVDAIQSAMFADHSSGRVFSRGGQLVQVRDAAPSTALEVQQGGAGVEIESLEGRRLDERIAKSCRIFEWRGNTYKPAAVPRVVTETLESRGGRGAPPLIGIASAPVILPDGRMEETPGYQESTGLYGAFNIGQFAQIRRYVIQSDVAVRLSAEDAAISDAFHQRELAQAKADAADALRYLVDAVFAEFPFRDAVDASAAVAALLTALVRPVIDVAPAFLVTAPVMASGKTELLRTVCRIAAGTVPGLNGWPAALEGRQKIIFSALRAGRAALLFDDLPAGMVLKCDAIAQLVTSSVYEGRQLGVSEVRRLPANVFVGLTGNNVCISEDLATRIIEICLDPRTDRADQRKYSRDVGRWADQHRADIVGKCLTLVKAYLDSGAPSIGAKPSRFPQWDRMVRGPIAWAGGEEVAIKFDTAFETDPAIELLRNAITAWRAALADREIACNELVGLLNDGFAPERQALTSALHELAAERRGFTLTAQSLGLLLKRHASKPVDGWALVPRFQRHTKVNVWAVAEVGAAK